MLIPLKKLIAKYNLRPKGVLHLGGHWAEEAKDYAACGIDRMIFVEADPDTFQELGRRIAKYPKAMAVEACLSNVDGDTVTFHRSNNEGQSSSFLALGTHAVVHPEVKYIGDLQLKTHRIDTLYNAGALPGFDECDFVNLDLQGAELLALKGMGELLHRFKAVYVEVNKNELYKGCPLVDDIDEYLDRFGFERVELEWCGNFGWGDGFYIKK